MFDINIRLDVCCNAAHSHPERIPCSTLTSTFECGLVWQEDAQVVEEAAGRPRRAVRNAQGTTSVKSTSKSTIVKLAPPKAVGLPKPPQVLAKVRGLVAEWKFGFMCWLHAMLANGMNSTNNNHVGLWMALGSARWGLPRNHKHRRKNESSSLMSRYWMQQLGPSPLRVPG